MSNRTVSNIDHSTLQNSPYRALWGHISINAGTGIPFTTNTIGACSLHDEVVPDMGDALTQPLHKKRYRHFAPVLPSLPDRIPICIPTYRPCSGVIALVRRYRLCGISLICKGNVSRTYSVHTIWHTIPARSGGAAAWRSRPVRPSVRPVTVPIRPPAHPPFTPGLYPTPYSSENFSVKEVPVCLN